MEKFISALCLLLALAAIVNSQSAMTSSNTSIEDTSIASQSTNATTIASTTIESMTAKLNTTTSSSITTPTTTKPSTTTPTTTKPTTTKPTTIKPTTKPTTIQPTTTTTPMPQPVTNTYIQRYDNGSICLMVKAAMSLRFQYSDKSNKTHTIGSNVPNQTNSTLSFAGSCKDNQTLRLDWKDENRLGDMSISINMSFSKDSKNYSLSTLDVNLILADKKSSKIIVEITSMSNETEFNTFLGDYYSCEKSSDIKLTHGTTLKLSDVEIQAFRSGNSTDFTGTMNNCVIKPKNKTSTLVPIIVGAALGGMVLIVLIGYCIGRRRARAGYQEMN